jgi:hypothetical protein
MNAPIRRGPLEGTVWAPLDNLRPSRAALLGSHNPTITPLERILYRYLETSTRKAHHGGMVAFKLNSAAPPVKFSEFTAKHGLDVEVTERFLGQFPGYQSKFDVPRYYAQYKNSDTKEPHVLVGTYGDGDTPEAAIEDYKRALTGKLLVIGAFTSERREIQCPNEWLPEAEA